MFHNRDGFVHYNNGLPYLGREGEGERERERGGGGDRERQREGEGGRECGGGAGEWEFGVSRCKLLYIEWIITRSYCIAQGTVFNIL